MRHWAISRYLWLSGRMSAEFGVIQQNMGVASYIVGYIEEAWPGVAAGGDPRVMEKLTAAADLIARHNEATLKSLPEHDEFPPLCRPMFSWAPSHAPMITYKNRLIHFAASMKQIDSSTRTWLDKVDSLLKTLYWESAYVRVQTAYMGTYEFTWQVPFEWIEMTCKGEVQPITTWRFSSNMEQQELESLRE